MLKFRSIAMAFVATIAAHSVGRADVYELKGGGEVVGTTLQPTDSGDYVVRTPEGAEVMLQRDALQRVVEEDDSHAEYRRRSRAMADTADAHRQLAAWCREHKLADESDHHLSRVVELDPSDEQARRSLGFQRIGDQWLKPDELMAQRGMKFYDGKFRTPQDIAIRQRNEQGEAVNIDWFAQLRTWRGWLDNRRTERVAEAEAQIRAINDPHAVPALVRLLRDEEDDAVFELLLATLGQLDHPLAMQTLVAYSLEDDDREIREQCLDYLVNGERPVGVLPYVQALKSKDNIIVNRAGHALGSLGEAAAISPLIDALVTTHKYQVGAESGGGSPISAGFNPNGGGGGLSLGGNGPQIIQQDRENERVLRALMKLSGNQNFEFDEQAWRHWYVDQQMRQHVNARRDE